MRASVAMLFVCACGPMRGSFEVSATSPVAVGAVVTVKGSAATTARFSVGQSARFPRDVTILKATVDPAAAWQRLECSTCDPSLLQFRALSANNGTITVEADDGFGTETFVESMVALVPDRVKVLTQPCPQLVYQAGIDFSVELQVNSGSTIVSMHKYAGAAPFAVEGGAGLNAPSPPVVWIKTANARGPGRLTSALDPSFSMPFTIITPDDVTGLELARYSAADAPLQVGRSGIVEVLLQHPGAPACRDNFVRPVTTATPEVCTVKSPVADRHDDGRYWTMVTGRAAGTCTLTVGLEGTSLSTTRNFEVLPP